MNIILKNKHTSEERPLIKCNACYEVLHIGDTIGHNDNYDVFCVDCSEDRYVRRGIIDDDWISGDDGWEEIEKEK